MRFLEIGGFAQTRAVSQPNLICSLMREISGKTAMPMLAVVETRVGLW